MHVGTILILSIFVIAVSNLSLIDDEPMIKLNEYESLQCTVMPVNSVLDYVEGFNDF